MQCVCKPVYLSEKLCCLNEIQIMLQIFLLFFPHLGVLCLSHFDLITIKSLQLFPPFAFALTKRYLCIKS